MVLYLAHRPSKHRPKFSKLLTYVGDTELPIGLLLHMKSEKEGTLPLNLWVLCYILPLNTHGRCSLCLQIPPFWEERKMCKGMQGNCVLGAKPEARQQN